MAARPVNMVVEQLCFPLVGRAFEPVIVFPKPSEEKITGWKPVPRSHLILLLWRRLPACELLP